MAVVPVYHCRRVRLARVVQLVAVCRLRLEAAVVQAAVWLCLVAPAAVAVEDLCL